MTTPRLSVWRSGELALLSALGALCILGAGTILAAAALAPDARIARCGGDDPGNDVLASFELKQARDFWKHFPQASRLAPELEVDTPAFVVVFDGPTRMTALSGMDTDASGGMTQVVLQDVVCVLLPASDMYPDGETLVYYGVSREGFSID